MRGEGEGAYPQWYVTEPATTQMVPRRLNPKGNAIGAAGSSGVPWTN
jgi:hypothetical protein